MKLKLQDLNFSAHLFIYEQYGSLYPPGVAEEGELCWGICREHPSPGRQGWKEKQVLLIASCSELLCGGARNSSGRSWPLLCSTAIKVRENLELAECKCSK